MYKKKCDMFKCKYLRLCLDPQVPDDDPIVSLKGWAMDRTICN